MLLLLEIKRHILRAPGRTVITALAAALLVCGMALYTRNIQVTQDTLDQLKEQMPVKVTVTSRDGSRTVSLSITSEDFDALTAQDVRDVLCTSPFSFSVKSVDGRSAEGSMHVHAANAIAALDGPSPQDFAYLEGWDESFLLADAPVCAVERSFAQENGIEPGSRLEAELFSMSRASGGIELTSVGRQELTVVALYKDSPALGNWDAAVPIGWLRGITESAVNRYGDPIPFCYDSASMYLADPQKMNVFKDAMNEQGFRQQSPLPDKQTIGDTLLIDDEMYIKTSADLVESLELYRTFMLPFFGLIMLTVALISFLTLRSSRRHIAIASSLGRQKLLNAAAPFFGTVAVQALGCAAALPAMCLAAGLLPASAGIVLGAFTLCAMGGTALALVFLFRFDALELLTKVD